MKNISKSVRIFIKKGYGKICILGILFFLARVVVSTVADVIPRNDYMEFNNYDDFHLYGILHGTGLLLQNIAFALFSVSMFYGALTNESLSKEAKRSLVIVSGIVMAALVLANRLMFLSS